MPGCSQMAPLLCWVAMRVSPCDVREGWGQALSEGITSSDSELGVKWGPETDGGEGRVGSP